MKEDKILNTNCLDQCPTNQAFSYECLILFLFIYSFFIAVLILRQHDTIYFDYKLRDEKDDLIEYFID